MLTGTPLDLTPFGAALQGIGVLYWLFVLGVITIILFTVEGRWWKAVCVVLALACLVLPVAYYFYLRYQEQQVWKVHMDKVLAQFQLRCQSAGEKIYRTVDDVDGVLLMKIRPTDDYKYWADQFYLNDPYGRDLSGDGYVRTFIFGEDKRNGVFSNGYSYVETVHPLGDGYYRYTGSIHKQDEDSLIKKEVKFSSALYGVTFDDISTKEDRELWIAGSSLRVIDLKKNEIIAERIGYMVDLGQGSRAGFRSPWLLAANYACPAFEIPVSSGSKSGDQRHQTRRFVEKVLKPKTTIAEK